MTEQASGTPSGTGSSQASTPAGETSSNSGGSFMRQRSAQLAQSMERQAAQPQGEPAGDAGRQQQQPDGRQQQQSAAERMIRIGDADYSEQRLNELIARDAEEQVRKSSLPKSENDYKIKNSDNFKLPEGVKFEFDQNDPALAAVRRFAHSRGMDQQALEGMLDLYAASRINEVTQQQRARQANLDQLGVAGPQRIEAVATWLQARAGADGKAMAETLRRYPAAPFVRAYENLIRQFSGQGGTDYSSSHRETQPADQTKIPGYDQMSFVQRRTYQMSQMLRGQNDRGGWGER